jgi:hypothetical protein
VNDIPIADQTGRHSRRAALHAGGAIVAALAAMTLPRDAAGSATPVAGAGADRLLIQAFGSGSLFPTQGDVGVPPYTLILWEAAPRGIVAIDWANRAADVVASEQVLQAIGDAAQPRAAIVARAEGDDAAAREAVWALRLVLGDLGSDPGAVTYQGEPLAAADAAWLGTAPAALPDGPQSLGPGFLLLAGLPTLDVSGSAAQLDLR